MTFVCPHCGTFDNPIWKPLYFKLYTSYADFRDFVREYPELAKQLPKKKTQTEDLYFIYKRVGKTRDIVHRIFKFYVHMGKRELFEKTPSEKATFVDLGQRKLAECC